MIEQEMKETINKLYEYNEHQIYMNTQLVKALKRIIRESNEHFAISIAEDALKSYSKEF
jgi:hypothetical protein